MTNLAKRIREILEGLYWKDRQFAISRNRTNKDIDHALNDILQAVRDVVPRKRHEGKHDGHRNDDKYWCYDCNDSADEEEFTNNWLFNQAIDEILKEIEDD